MLYLYSLTHRIRNISECRKFTPDEPRSTTMVTKENYLLGMLVMCFFIAMIPSAHELPFRVMVTFIFVGGFFAGKAIQLSDKWF